VDPWQRVALSDTRPPHSPFTGRPRHYCRDPEDRMTVPILKQSHYLIASIQSALSDQDLIGLRDLAELVGQHRARGVIIDVTVGCLARGA